MYRFGLAVTVGEEESEVVGQRSSVMTSIDTDVIFSPPNLQLEVASHMAEVCSGFLTSDSPVSIENAANIWFY